MTDNKIVSLKTRLDKHTGQQSHIPGLMSLQIKFSFFVSKLKPHIVLWHIVNFWCDEE